MAEGNASSDLANLFFVRDVNPMMTVNNLKRGLKILNPKICENYDLKFEGGFNAKDNVPLYACGDFPRDLCKIDLKIRSFPEDKKMEIVDVFKPSSKKDPGQTNFERIIVWVENKHFAETRLVHNIPKELKDWTSEHTLIWYKWVVKSFKLRYMMNLKEWRYTGQDLLNMNQKEATKLVTYDHDGLFWHHITGLMETNIVRHILKMEGGLHDHVTKEYPEFVSNHRDDNGDRPAWLFLTTLTVKPQNEEIVAWVKNDGLLLIKNADAVAEAWVQSKYPEKVLNGEVFMDLIKNYYSRGFLKGTRGNYIQITANVEDILGMPPLEVNKFVKEANKTNPLHK